MEEIENIEEFDSVELTEEINEQENYAEVLELTQFDNNTNNTLQNYSTDFGIVAQYDNISVVDIDKRHKAQAKSFVSKITSLINKFSDMEMSDIHKNYVNEVGKLQMSNLVDLLTLVDINRQMLNNIVHRINAEQANDYVLINTYNNLVNQHMKLVKELQNTYKNIPSVIKKMRTDVVTNQELIETTSTNEVITENFGETQFNNQKALLKKLREESEKQNNV